MLHPSYSGNGTALYLDEYLRYIKDDGQLSSDEEHNLLRLEQQDLKKKYLTLSLLIAALIGTGIVIALAAMLFLVNGHLGYISTFLLSMAGFVGTAREIKRIDRGIRHEYRIRAAVPKWTEDRALGLDDARMQKLISTFGSNWRNMQELLLERNTAMSSVAGGITELYFVTVAMIDRQREHELLEEDEYQRELQYAADSAHSRYMDMWADWSVAMHELYTLSCSKPH